MGASDDRNQSIAYLQLGWLHSKAECGEGTNRGETKDQMKTKEKNKAEELVELLILCMVSKHENLHLILSTALSGCNDVIL